MSGIVSAEKVPGLIAIAIRKLTLEEIKVDASFVRDLEGNEASRKIVSSVTALTGDLSLSCVVEGVETREKLDILQGLGCRLIKGSVYSKLRKEADVASLLARQTQMGQAMARARGGFAAAETKSWRSSPIIPDRANHDPMGPIRCAAS